MVYRLPYGLTWDNLSLESTSRGKDTVEVLDWLLRKAVDPTPHRHMDDEELVRILKSAVALYVAGAGTIGEALDTAIVWSRG